VTLKRLRNGRSLSLKWSDAPSAKDAGGDQSVGMEDERKNSACDTYLTQSIGYRVDAPEGHVGIVQKVPEAGRPRRPLALVVSDGKTVRLVSLRRIAEVEPLERRIVLQPGGAASLPLARTSTSWTLEAA
jgi:hypothetical protein